MLEGVFFSESGAHDVSSSHSSTITFVSVWFEGNGVTELNEAFSGDFCLSVWVEDDPGGNGGGMEW